MLLLKCIGNPLWIRLCFGYRLLRVQLQAHCRMHKVAKTYTAEKGPSRFQLFCFSVPFSSHFPLQLSWVLFLLFSCILHVRALFSWSCFSLHSNLSSLEALLVSQMYSPGCLRSTVLVIVSFHHSFCTLVCQDVCMRLPISTSDLSSDSIPG